ncbi:Ribonuclease H-like protein [Metarhizium robertsii ARSEF 23]|uniref:Ribonuclease H-like protein n=1 Tax=Metarhizium robertsii (strain ARSEF 23 / ATCC MYA-3075) TaxID=655844 RepID=E9FA33_METRA|nr:Ribonuclease H-like protein [Metarhizium robertsii ARSEF 23]EFY95431.2 Ribonuclease H-like protein [Metarhizium robertsii ARSEF 23]
MGKPEGRFGYADDTVILCTGQSLEETSGIASEYLQELVNWGAANGISFDPEKTEVMHFSPGRRETVLPVRHGDVEKQPEAAMRRLGLWLDRKLTFKTCGEVGKAQTVAHHLRSLGNTRRGPKPSAVQRAKPGIQVQPRHAGDSRRSTPSPRWRQPTKEGPSRIQQLVRKMSKALKQAIRAILEDHTDRCPAPRKRHASGSPTAGGKITPLLCAHQIPGPHTPAGQTHHRGSATAYHQVYQVEVPAPAKDLSNPVEEDEQIAWELPTPRTHPAQSAKDFDRWLQTIPPLSLIVYSDGSLSSSGAAGYGYAVHQSGRSVCQGAGRLGPAEVFDAEAKGALEGLKAALRLSRSASQRIVVCLDNIAAAACLRGKPSDSSQRVFLTFQTGCAQPEPADAVPTLAFLRKTVRQRSKIAVQAWWDASAPDKYKHLNLKLPSNCPPELALPRIILHHLLAARTYHGDFADYHERLHHNNACVACSCGQRKAPANLLYCRKIQPRCLDEACSLPDRGDQPGNRKRFRQIRQAGEGKLFLRKDLPAPLDEII